MVGESCWCVDVRPHRLRQKVPSGIFLRLLESDTDVDASFRARLRIVEWCDEHSAPAAVATTKVFFESPRAIFDESADALEALHRRNGGENDGPPRLVDGERLVEASELADVLAETPEGRDGEARDVDRMLVVEIEVMVHAELGESPTPSGAAGKVDGATPPTWRQRCLLLLPAVRRISRAKVARLSSRMASLTSSLLWRVL